MCFYELFCDFFERFYVELDINFYKLYFKGKKKEVLLGKFEIKEILFFKDFN